MIAPHLTDVAVLSALIEGKPDTELDAIASSVGVDSLLEGVLDGLCRRYAAHGVPASALLQWKLSTPAGARAFSLQLDSRQCLARTGESERPNAVLETSLATFLRLLAGRTNALVALAKGELRITGDRALALRFQLWFPSDQGGAPLEASTPRELARLIEGRPDEELAASVAVAGIDRTLDQVFAGMVKRYLPGAGPRRRAVVEFTVQTEAGPRIRQFIVERERPNWHEGSRERADVRIELRLADLLRLVSGRLDAFIALAQKKLKVRGNYLMASGFQRWFDIRA